MPVTYCDVFSFLWRSIQAMGCFFDCFGVRHDPPRCHLLPSSPPSTIPDEGAQKIRISSLFTDEERAEGVVKERENLVRRVGWSELDEELVEEAKFLKACGTLPQTPAELRKGVSRAEVSEKSDTQMPLSALMSLPESHADVEQAETSAEKSARFGLHESSPETPEENRKEEASTENLQRSDLRGHHSTLKSSPYPTPRKITDDMQTPGTVFATNMKNLTKGNARIRSQYVYTVLNPIENLSLQELKEENAVLDFSEIGNATPRVADENVERKENVGEATLSSWLKPKENDDCLNLRKNNIGDRPIMGLVATHWTKQDKTSHVSPKSWDGNGIPNSTSKYKEDQKVRWHATPFEERLEKALSEETMPQRKPVTGMPIMLEEREGDDNDDTATSHIQSTSCLESVVSF